MTDTLDLIVFVTAFLAGMGTMALYRILTDPARWPDNPKTCEHVHTATVYCPTTYRETCTDCGTNLEPGEGTR